jgi:hypothetical protein
MQNLFLIKIRLTWYFVFFLATAIILALLIPRINVERGVLTLFSVNSFLFGFYLSPIMTSQKVRIDELHKAARAEANAIFDMVLGIKQLPEEIRNNLQQAFTDYLRTCARQRRPSQGEEQYEALITYCVNYKGSHKDEIAKLLDKLVKNQQNRTQFSMLLTNRIFSHEWLILLVLYGITTGFVLTIDTGDGIGFRLVAGLLAAGLTMLMIILIKLSTLTHKKAHQAWNPYKRLIETHYYRID